MAARRALLTALLPPLGSSVKFQVEMLQQPQGAESESTPAPTYAPGVACPCLENSCFQAYDKDGDGCLSQAECDLQAPLGANCSLSAWNPNGDDCINETTEWPGIFERTNGEVCPLAIAEAPSECAAGFYLAGTPPKCERCYNGATRRRRSLECTSCKPLVDRGDFDACVDPGLCDRCIGSDPTAGCKCPCSSFSVGDEVSSFGLPVDPLCVASENETCELFKVKAKVTAVSPDPGTGLCNIQTNSLTPDMNCTAVYGAGSPQCTQRPLVHVCTTTDGTEFSRKHSGNNPPICACGEKHCTQKEMCHIAGGERGEDVCVKAGPYPVHATPAPTVGARGDPHLVNLQGEHFDINHAGDFTLLRFPQNEEKPAELSMLANIQPEFGRPCTTYITSLELSGDWLGGKSLQIRSYRRSHSNETDDDFLGVRLLEGVGDAPWQNIEEFEPAERVLSKKGAPVHVSLAKSQWFKKKRSAGRVPAVAGMFTLHVRNQKNPEGAKVVVRQDLPDQEHLNVAVRRLSQLGRVDVGGLLGFDEHPESLELVSAQCRHHRAVTPTQVESTEDMPYYFRPAPKGRRHQNTDAAATLITGKKMQDEDEDSDSEAVGSAMCKCPSGHGVYGSFTAEGVIVEARDANFLMAKASW